LLTKTDSSVEGIISTPESGKRVWGVQFHPESAGGPLDTIEMFSDFVNECGAGKSTMVAKEVKIEAAPSMVAAAA
jgi:carbamoyl-phosphate synthase small subunit